MNAFQHYTAALERHPMRLSGASIPAQNGDLRDRKIKILTLLATPRRVSEIAKLIDQDRRNMCRVLSKMEEAGTVMRVTDGLVEMWVAK